MLSSMRELRFPDDRAVGKLDWLGAPPTGAPAQGRVLVPDDAEVALFVPAFRESPGGGRVMTETDRADFSFVRDLPPGGIHSLRIRAAREDALGELAHLAPGLRHLHLMRTGFSDAALAAIARLSELVFLQTWGNEFTDVGVQQLVALQKLESLYLEEETLTAAAFAFADRLPHLARLGADDVAMTNTDLAELRHRLPHVTVG